MQKKEKEIKASRSMMVNAAVAGAHKAGYAMKPLAGRGLSNVWEASKDKKTKIVSIRTTRDRWIAFPPLDNGTRWKTLSNVELVLVSAVDNRDNPKNIEVYLFPADAVIEHFNASYVDRIKNGHAVHDNFGMWIKLDTPSSDLPTQVGGGLADEYPAIARFTMDELENEMAITMDETISEDCDSPEEATFSTINEVISWARSEITRLSGMPIASIKMDLKFKA